MGNLKYIVFVLLCFIANQSEAKSRNCTKEEKKVANQVLFDIESNEALRQKLLLTHLPFGVPQDILGGANEEILVQQGYVMNHDLDLRTSLWVAYKLTKADMEGAKGKDRVNCFRKDPRIEQGSASSSDYKEPTFDQGHLANDADLKDTLIEQLNSYLYTNMSPQYCRFNRGIWLSLEHLSRAWAKKYGEIYVMSGALFDKDHDGNRDHDSDASRMVSKNGKSRVAVPNAYYKTILRPLDNGMYTSITFVLEHTNDDQGASWSEVKDKLIVLVNSIETVEAMGSMIQLFPNIERKNIVQSIDGDGWDLTLGRSNMSRSCK